VGWALLRWLSPRCSFQGPPKGTFSALEGVRAGKFTGRVVHPPGSPPAGPWPLRVRAGLGQEKLGSWPVFWSHHRGARLAGKTLVLLDDRKRACFEAVYGPFCVRDDPGMKYWRLPPPVRLAGNWTSVISWWSRGFHHWFLDTLPKLSLLTEFPPDTRVLVPAPLLRYQAETLAWLGLTDRCRPTSERHLLLENFYFAAPTAMTGSFDRYAVEFLRRSFLDKADPAYDPPRRFFLHRVGQVRGIENGAEVLEFFRRRDWPIIDAEQLPLARQLQLFAQAQTICALHGAGLTHLLWCQPGCRVIELLADNYLNGVYEGLAEMVQARHSFALFPGTGDFKARIDLKRLEQLLDSTLSASG
jgi:hypothetical protein